MLEVETEPLNHDQLLPNQTWIEMTQILAQVQIKIAELQCFAGSLGAELWTYNQAICFNIPIYETKSLTKGKFMHNLTTIRETNSKETTFIDNKI